MIRDRDNDSQNEEHLRLIRRVQDDLTRKFKVFSGSNTDGDDYESIEEMWIAEGVVVGRGGAGTTDGGGGGGWYKKSHGYWQDDGTAVPATIDGMLGGFAALTEGDLLGSRRFVEDLFLIRSKGLRARLLLAGGDVGGGDVDVNVDRDGGTGRRKTRCCECGAGIGRVSKGLLLPLGFEVCDLIETSPRLIGAAPDYIGDPDASRCRYICTGLQDFEPAPDTYDVIWIQWVIGYLTDHDLVQFFRRMALSLHRPDGVLILKDNVCADGAFMVDRDDSSLTRSLPYLLALVREAGLRIVTGAEDDGGEGMLRYQDGFPEGIFPVPMIALELDE